MSAFVVSRAHIDYLVSAALAVGYGRSTGPLSWVWNIDRAAGTYDRATLPRGDFDRAAEVGQMLWNENVRSVQHRYSDTPPTELPGWHADNLDAWTYEEHRGGFGVSRKPGLSPVQVLSACACYRYQSCEHPGWKESEAAAFIEALERRAIGALPGYEDAAWEITEEHEAA